MNTKSGKIIRNVGTLDLRHTTAEAIAQIQRVENAATVLYSAATAALVPGLAIGNVANLVQVPADAKLITGQGTLSRETFQNQAAPLDIVAVGQLTINPDVTVEELNAGLASLLVYGQLLYPEHLAGVLQAKMKEMNGHMQAYSAQAKIIMGKLDLTELYLRGLADNTTLLVFGKVTAAQLLPDDLLAQKVKKLEVFGKVLCHEENAATLLARTTGAQVTTIPTGFTYLEQALALDANLLDTLPGKKLYGRSLRIEPDVTAEALDGALEALRISDTLIAPAALRTVVGRKVNLLETRAIFYEGELWLVEHEMTLRPSRFDYLEGQATLVVFGELTIAPEVEPKLLAQHFHKVYNWGEIHCTPEQTSALQARLGINEGKFLDAGVEVATDENVIGNAAYLAL